MTRCDPGHSREGSGAAGGHPPGTPSSWQGRLREVDRMSWGPGEDWTTGLEDVLRDFGVAPLGPLDAEPGSNGVVAVGLLVGAAAAARAAGAPTGRRSPCAAVPEVVAVAYRLGERSDDPPGLVGGAAGPFEPSWDDVEHAAAVEAVRAAIGRGDVYQVSVVGHRSAAWVGDPGAVAEVVAVGPHAGRWAGSLHGPGWAVATASPERLLSVIDGVARTGPVKGTRPAGAVGEGELRASVKERAEHVMIVDLARNDLGRVATVGTVGVEQLYALVPWAGLVHAESTVRADLRPGTTLGDLLRAVLPGGSVTGAPKLAALAQVAALEPVGRGPSMGAFGLLRPGRVDLALTIRTAAVADGRVHLWAGGGVTWSSDPAAEVAEAHAKAAPLAAALLAAGSRAPGSGATGSGATGSGATAAGATGSGATGSGATAPLGTTQRGGAGDPVGEQHREPG